MNKLGALLSLLGVLVVVRGQRPPPGVNPHHYQGQGHPPAQQQYQPPPPQYQQGGIPQQPAPVHQNFQQHPQQVVPQHVQQPPHNPNEPPQGHQRQIFDAENMQHEKDHIQEHLHASVDTSKMTDQELQFHYFKMHDADNNNKLDGCELIKSLIHWHEQGSKEKQGGIEEKIFKDEELVNLIDPILNVDDGNKDGYIDYPEFIRAQQKNAASQKQERV